MPFRSHTKKSSIMESHTCPCHNMTLHTKGLRLRQCLFYQNRYRYHISQQYTITIYYWYIMNLMHVGRPPLRSYLIAGMGAEEEEHAHAIREYIMQLSDDGMCPTAAAAGTTTATSYHRLDSRTHLRAGHPQMKSTGGRSANESQWPDPKKIGIPAMATEGTLHIG